MPKAGLQRTPGCLRTPPIDEPRSGPPLGMGTWSRFWPSFGRTSAGRPASDIWPYAQSGSQMGSYQYPQHGLGPFRNLGRSICNFGPLCDHTLENDIKGFDPPRTSSQFSLASAKVKIHPSCLRTVKQSKNGYGIKLRLGATIYPGYSFVEKGVLPELI